MKIREKRWSGVGDGGTRHGARAAATLVYNVYCAKLVKPRQDGPFVVCDWGLLGVGEGVGEERVGVYSRMSLGDDEKWRQVVPFVCSFP